ncbi:MAG: response regulator transcription factor [Weeksellaceae bacterium]
MGNGILSSKSVLIVEDELLIAYAIKNMLEPEYEVLKPVISYDGAVRALENKRVDIVLLDINLGGVATGMDVASYINKQYASIPFIFLTAQSQPQIIDKLLSYQPASYLSKPICKPDLYAAINLAFFKQKADNDIIEIVIGKKSCRVYLGKVLYVESEHVYSHLYLVDGEELLRISLNNLVGQSNNQLRRINRRIAVNKKFIKTETSKEITLFNNQSFIISKKY